MVKPKNKWTLSSPGGEVSDEHPVRLETAPTGSGCLKLGNQKTENYGDI